LEFEFIVPIRIKEMPTADVTVVIICSALILSLTVSDPAIAQLVQQEELKILILTEAVENPNVLAETILRRLYQSKRQRKSV